MATQFSILFFKKYLLFIGLYQIPVLAAHGLSSPTACGILVP